MNIKRTDIAIEAHELAQKNKGHKIDGVIYNEENGLYKTTSIEIISHDGELETGKAMGKYITVDTGKIWERDPEELKVLCEFFSRFIKSLSGEAKSVLVVGLGNSNVTADAIGPDTVKHLLVTRHLKDNEIFDDLFNISAICPGVVAQTGIETAETVKCLVKELSPSAVIAIDALASRDINRLGSIIQISNTGIVPGSGVGNHRSELSLMTLGVPVIAIGIPTVVDALTLASNVLESSGVSEELKNTENYENMFVTPKDCDKIVAFMSKAIGYSINMAFHRNLSFNEMVSLTS